MVNFVHQSLLPSFFAFPPSSKILHSQITKHKLPWPKSLCLCDSKKCLQLNENERKECATIRFGQEHKKLFSFVFE